MLFLGLYAGTLCAARNVTLQYEKDRDMKKSGNIVHVESDTAYMKKKVADIADKYASLEKKIGEMESKISDLEKTIISLKSTSNTPQ